MTCVFRSIAWEWSEAMQRQLLARNSRQERTSVVRIGQIRIDAVNIEETAQAFVDYCRSVERAEATRPLYSTSLNGQVISLCTRDRELSKSISSAIR